jgi:zinc and cadmium transporter
VSVVGAVFLTLRQSAMRAVLPLLVALAAGALLGNTFLHLLPDAVEVHGGFTPHVAWGVLGGLLGFFLIEGVLHWHHHGEDVHEHGPDGVHSLGWMNLLGDFVHNIMDGMLIAAAFSVDEGAGWATTIAVLLHEIPQEFGDFGVLVHAGFTPRKALLLNLLTGFSAVIGALIVIWAPASLALDYTLVPVAAGGFLYIACADLVPELRKRVGGMRMLATWSALGAGLLLMLLVSKFAPHTHVLPDGTIHHHGPGEEHGDDHHGHSHD